MYTATLVWIAGAVVLSTWAFLVFVGLFPGSALGTLQPISSAVGFAVIGLGLVEFGVVVLNVQLIWLLPDDHDESGAAPFLCGYCLLGQGLLMFPPLIILAIVLVPLVLISIAGVGWYFQKFTSLKLGKLDRVEHQDPMSIRALLWMPVFLLVLGLIPLGLAMFFGPYVFDFALSNSDRLGIVLICSAMGMMSVSLLPLIACYGFLFFSQCTRAIQVAAVATVIVCFCLSVLVESLASNHTSAIMPLVWLASFMFVIGVWAGLKPWQKEGLHVVFAKPRVSSGSIAGVTFDEAY